MNDSLYKLLTKGKYKNKMEMRTSVGKKVSIIGILTNIFLFIGKFSIGILVGSVSIQADGINNLSDAGASVISLISFKISDKPADRKHPYGHARIEYVTSMIVSFVILIVSIELFRDSLDKILHPTRKTLFSMVSIIILSVSIVAKIFLVFINKSIGKKIDSEVMEATATDSFSDALASFAVLVSMIVMKIINFDLDGYMGIIVAVLVFVSGVKILLETIDRILGTAPDEKIVENIKNIVDRYPEALGMHDLLIHNYGPGRIIASLHVEVDGKEDIFKTHDAIDDIEKQIKDELSIICTIHMDPIVTDNKMINELHQIVLEKVQEIDKNFAIHDFRFVDGQKHKNIIFDIEVPFECSMTENEVIEMVNEKIRELSSNYNAVITVDRK